MTQDNKATIAIDRGGTFTDVIYTYQGQEGTFKLLSVDPNNYADANIEGIRRVIEIVTGKKALRNVPLDTSMIASIRLGTTVATNALLERKGAPCALVTTKGFKDLLHIGDQSRPDLFALNIVKPGVLYQHVIEADERVTMPAFLVDPSGYDAQDLIGKDNYVHGETKEVFEVLRPLDKEKLTKDLIDLKSKGISSVAIVFVHGYNYQKHEKEAGEIARSLGFKNVSMSHETLPIIKTIPRGQSTVVDSYLTPILKEYIQGFLKGLQSDFEEHTRLEFMQSDGGLCSWRNFTGLKSLLSGPAGGVVGLSKTAYDPHYDIPVIGFDMGGTSTDVSRYAGSYEFSFESVTAGIKIATPQLDINTIAAGGGSMLFYRNGVFDVGPESAGSHPGPACYRKGGPLTITDANLFTGRIIPDFFPKIFGPNEDQELDYEASKLKFEQLTEVINRDNPKSQKTPHEVALGFLEVANYEMAKPIRELTDAKGNDVRKHALASFGGAGGQHAAAIAKILKINRVIIHKHSSLLSAYGISLSDIVSDFQEPCARVYNSSNRDDLLQEVERLQRSTTFELLEQGIGKDTVKSEVFFNMGYKGSDTRIMIGMPSDKDFLKDFYKIHEKEFAFNNYEKDVLVSDIRVRSTGNVLPDLTERSPYKDFDNATRRPVKKLNVITSRPVYFNEGAFETKFYPLKDIDDGEVIEGPAIILDETQTILVEPNSEATVLPRHIIIEMDVSNNTKISSTVIDPIQLSIFTNKFGSIANDMSRKLQKVSVSSNVKERYDFSCALFDSQGDLIVNAPNVPVHLGLLTPQIKYQLEYWKGKLHEGDILCTNSPSVGGTHLPDLTVITPVFVDGKIECVAASRAHHSEIGGSAPGSSSSYARDIKDEGVNIEVWKIVTKGEFDDEGLIKHFVDDPRSWGVSGTRNIEDNISDLKAQIAANQRGIVLLQELFKEYGSETVLLYMKGLKDTAEAAIIEYLKLYYQENKDRLPLKATDFMDDGGRIEVSIDIDGETGRSTIDFTGTSLEYYSNLNAPKSVTLSAVIYVLRCLVDTEIPLNQGFLNACDIVIPENSLINPSKHAAVCAGNGMTSQRITDVLFKAFGFTSATGGCMNGINFGTGGYDEHGKLIKGFGYTETVGQGNCAGIIKKNGIKYGFHGFSGTQTNMTNTRITDPEVLEQRYPCLLHEFSIRENSGGKGKFNGGNGLIREVKFLSGVHVSLVTQRRVFAPWGVYGGCDGKRGENFLGRNRGDGVIQWIQLPSLAEIEINEGDILRILTPGGGGFGKPSDTDEFWGLTSDSKASFSSVPLSTGSLGVIKEAENTSQ